jgi:hypothetical protein
MALKTKCLTPGAQFHTKLSSEPDQVTITVELPTGTLEALTETEAEVLEALLHNQLELVLWPYFIRAKNRSAEYNRGTN